MRFLKPKLAHLEDPLGMAGMAEAASRIHEAVEKKERILIFGDYDADGVTASALLHGLLGHLGADREVYLPSRMVEGYGLTPAAVCPNGYQCWRCEVEQRVGDALRSHPAFLKARATIRSQGRGAGQP